MAQLLNHSDRYNNMNCLMTTVIFMRRTKNRQQTRYGIWRKEGEGPPLNMDEIFGRHVILTRMNVRQKDDMQTHKTPNTMRRTIKIHMTNNIRT